MSPGLSEDEQVATLASIAGLEDLEHARRMLRQHGGDLEAAVNTAMGFTAPPDPSNAVGHPDPRDGGRSAPGSRPRQRVRPLRPNPLVQLLNIPVDIVRATFGIVFKVIGGVLVGLVGRNNARRIAYAATGGDTDDPVESATRFKRMMTREFGDDLPNFLEVSHGAALRAAADELKLLFVYLHSSEHPGSRAFCREVLSHPDVTGTVNSSFVAWGGDVGQTDAHLLASRLQPSTFPYVALMAATPGERGGSLVLGVEGAVEPGDLARLLADAAEERGFELSNLRAERDARATERRIRDEQDAAYRAALEADARREREAAERRAAEEEEEARARALERAAIEEAAAVAAEEEARLRSVEKRREEKSAVLADEPPEGAEGVCAVLVRFPDGSRQQRRFLGDDTVENLYTWVDTLEEHTGLHYSLVSNFPRKVFSRTDDGGVTLNDGDLCPQATLMYRLDD